ncbi:hypothetical protein TPDSL_23280 [Terrisporobacter petrolearius]|uniref:hypothetical protein n=1 Tax=Terrisporobacter petrolearius TaxID=1460447 RepID=UPI0033677A92
MNWILDEAVHNMKNSTNTLKKEIDEAEAKTKILRNHFSTKDIYEAAAHEYWKGYKAALKVGMKMFEEQLQEIEDMKKEDIKETELAEEDLQENKKRAYCE